MQVLGNIIEEAGINLSMEERVDISRVNNTLPGLNRVNSIRPQHPSGNAKEERSQHPANRNLTRPPPRFLVLDLTSIHSIDASGARGCFLQLAKMCAMRNITVCAAGADNRINWILESHDTAHHMDIDGFASAKSSDKIILFAGLDEGEGF
jgi:hypothetical protein